VRTIVIAASIAMTLLVASCQRTEDRHLDRQVRPAELVGTWTMTQGSVRDIGVSSPIDPLQHTITIRADDTCHFHTFPSALTSVGSLNPVLDGECRWRLRNVTGRQTLLLDIVAEPPLSVRYNFFAQNGTLVLWQHVGDPDAWRYVEYVKH
jgi:hypothetical protein